VATFKAEWVTRVGGFVEGGVPLNTTGNLVSRDAGCSPQRFADVKGAPRSEKGAGQEERGCIPENYGRGKRTRAIYVQHSRVARFRCSLITRERNGWKGLGANWKRNYHDVANMLPNAMSLYENVSRQM